MKKIFLAILILVFTTGCVVVKDSSIDALVDTTVNSKYQLYNHVNRGYKYYLPRELKAEKTDEYNEILKSKYYDYYLYIDIVGYDNKTDIQYTVDQDLYYSRVLGDGNKTGIINIKEINEDEYIINVIYHYAKIEVKSNKKDINKVVTNALVIVSSIQYNDDVIKTMIEDNKLSSSEEKVNIFDEENNEYDLDVDEDDVYTGNEEEEYDPDVIN